MDKLHVTIRGDSMWPTLIDGQEIICKLFHGQELTTGQIVVFRHPFDNELITVKRIKEVSDNQLFVEGDNPDPTASSDSHNFGMIKLDSVVAVVDWRA